MGLAVNNLTAQAPFPQDQTPEPPTALVEKQSNGTILSKEPSPLGYNCVAYAKSRKEIPQGMATLYQKKSHIVSNSPEEGKIGVTAEGPVGHLVYVEKVKTDAIVISEGNFIRGYITVREVPRNRIMGYLP